MICWVGCSESKLKITNKIFLGIQDDSSLNILENNGRPVSFGNADNSGSTAGGNTFSGNGGNSFGNSDLTGNDRSSIILELEPLLL